MSIAASVEVEVSGTGSPGVPRTLGTPNSCPPGKLIPVFWSIATHAPTSALSLSEAPPVRAGRSPAGGQTGDGSRPTDQLGVTVGRGGRRRRWPAGCRPSDRPGRRAVPLELNQADAAEQRAGHDGPTARAGTREG